MNNRITQDIEEAKKRAAAGDFPAARERLEKALKAAPDHPEALFELGKIAYITKEYREAERLLGKAAGNGGANVHGLLLLAKTCKESGKKGRAIQVFEDILSKGLPCREACRELGDLYREKEKWGPAEEMYGRYLREAPGDRETLTQLVRLYGEGGRFGKIVALAESSPEAGWGAGELGKGLARAYRETGDYRTALGLLEALRKDESEGWVHAERGKNFLGLGDHEKAAAELRKALDYAPADDVLRYELGCLYRAKGDSAGALAEFNRIKRKRPFRNLYREMAQAFVSLKKHYQALVAYRKALGRDPSSYSLQRNLIKVYLRMGRYASALKQYARTRRSGHDSPELHFDAAAALRLSGSLRQATGETLAGLKLGGDYARAYGELKRINAAREKRRGKDGAPADGGYCPSMPSTLMVVPTRRCNIQCTMCGTTSETQTLPFEAFERIGPLIPSVDTLRWQGGEVFLVEYFEKAFRKIVRSRPGIRHVIFTNGLLLSDRWVRTLSGANIELTFSIDTPVKTAYEKIRKGARFDTLLRNVDRVRRAFEPLPGRQAALNAIVMKSTVRDLGLFPDFCREHGITKLTFGFMYPERLPEENVFARRNTRVVRDLCRIVGEVEAKCREAGITFSCNFGYLLREAAGAPAREREIFKCRRPWNSIFVDADGSVRPWCACDIPAGSLMKNSLEEIWNEEIMRTYRTRLAEEKTGGWCRRECVRGIET